MGWLQRGLFRFYCQEEISVVRSFFGEFWRKNPNEMKDFGGVNAWLLLYFAKSVKSFLLMVLLRTFLRIFFTSPHLGGKPRCPMGDLSYTRYNHIWRARWPLPMCGRAASPETGRKDVLLPTASASASDLLAQAP